MDCQGDALCFEILTIEGSVIEPSVVRATKDKPNLALEVLAKNNPNPFSSDDDVEDVELFLGNTPIPIGSKAHTRIPRGSKNKRVAWQEATENDDDHPNAIERARIDLTINDLVLDLENMDDTHSDGSDTMIETGGERKMNYFQKIGAMELLFSQTTITYNQLLTDGQWRTKDHPRS